ncbi:MULTISPECIES: DUF413 domain-containing protein [unclassified Gilliamella]|uniref:DUF413 domain-containing protein n=1 Tax=unclassified Gilliamella TaxID=2685620 RepID=UPI00080DA10B|nr:DUF413 domain-containing protein [Gilliamella apicola]OCG23049.1 hypothetical protein A9G23_00025 [Gilliamella apicola]OCG23834.1 hypothetical protein A9G22_05305 [Gilliamella apicola]
MAESFVSQQRFFDTKNYPRGFSRHGDFTIKEALILEKHGCAFKDLDAETRKPSTAEEKSFVAVCKGKKEPTTDFEKTWLKYLSRINKPKRFHTLSGGKPQVDVTDDFVDNDD